MYFNTHTHLNSEDLFDERARYVQNALDKGVTRLCVAGYDVESSKRAVQIAHEFDNIICTVGISPNDCENTTGEDFAVICELARDEKVKAIGEIGLDYHWDVPKDKQMIEFHRHLDLAKELNKPVVIHCREAYEDTFQILKEAGVPGIMHCYSGSAEMALRFIDIGFVISLAGPVTFKNAKKPQAVAKTVPLDHLLIETDDPYMAPVPLRGTTNEPANCVYVCAKIAELKEMDAEDVAKATYTNACRVFSVED